MLGATRRHTAIQHGCAKESQRSVALQRKQPTAVHYQELGVFMHKAEWREPAHKRMRACRDMHQHAGGCCPVTAPVLYRGPIGSRHSKQVGCCTTQEPPNIPPPAQVGHKGKQHITAGTNMQVTAAQYRGQTGSMHSKQVGYCTTKEQPDVPPPAQVRHTA